MIWLVLSACSPDSEPMPVEEPVAVVLPKPVAGLERLPQRWTSVDQRDGHDVLGCSNVAVNATMSTVLFAGPGSTEQYTVTGMRDVDGGVDLEVTGAGGPAQIVVRWQGPKKAAAAWLRPGSVDVYVPAAHEADYPRADCP